MKIIQTLSFSSAKHLAAQLGQNHEKRSVYYYGFQIIIGALIKVLLLTVLSILTQSFAATMIVALVFASLRTMAGGYHMDTYGRCIAVSLALFLAAGAAAQHTYQYWPFAAVILFIAASLIVSSIILYKWAPRDTPNRPITKDKEIRKFKKQSLIYLLFFAAVMALIMLLKPEQYVRYVLAACFGLLLEVFTISPAGYRFFDHVKGNMDKAGKDLRKVSAR